MRAPRLLLRLMGKTLALLALFVVFTAGTAKADVCYVDTLGDNAQSGDSPSTAKQTIAACLAISGDGDIIRIEAGEYNEDVIVTDDITFEAYTTGSFTRVLIDGDGAGTAFTVNGGAVVFQPLTDPNLSDGVFRLGQDNTTALNVSEGSLTITDPDGPNGDGRVRIPSGKRVIRDNDTQITGALTYLGVVVLEYTDNDPTDVNIAAGGEFQSDFGGAGSELTVNIGDDVLTFASATDIADLNVGANSELNGTIIIDGTAINIAGPGNVGTLDVQDGNVTISANTAVNSVDIDAGYDDTFDLNTFTLTINGDFIREGGTFTSGNGATFAFVGDNQTNEFNPGPNFAIETVTIDKNGGTLNITEDVSVTESGAIAFLVADGTTVDFDNEQVIVTSNGFVDIDGTVTSLSTIVFRADNAEIRGTGEYGNILVTTGAAANDLIVTAGEDVTFTGTLTLSTGSVTLNGNLQPADDANIVVNVASSNGINVGPGGGVFNPDGNAFDLTYQGDIPGTYTADEEFDPAGANESGLRNLTVTAFDGTIDASAENGGTIGGFASLTGDDLTVTFPTGAVTIEGSLTVEDDVVLNGATAITLEAATNSVVGVVAGAATLTLEDGVTLSGAAGADANESEVTDVTVADNASAVIEDIHQINGGVTVNDGASLTLGLAGEREVTGSITVATDGIMLTLASDVNVGGNVTINDGTLAFGANDLNVNGDFTTAADVTMTAADGALVFDTAGSNLDLNDSDLPNLRIDDVTVTLDSDANITSSLDEDGAGLLAMGANDLAISGDVSTDGTGTGFIDATTGTLTFNTTTLTMTGANSMISTGFTIAEGETLTLASGDANDWVLRVDDGALTLSGTLALGDQDVAIIDGNNLINDGGNVTAGEGILVFEGGGAIIDVNDATLGIPNLSIVGATSVEDGAVQITGTLFLEAAFSEGTDGEIVIGDLATIVINAGGVLVDEADFDGLVSVIYNTPSTTGEEVGGGNLENLEINAAVVVDQDITVNGALTVNADLDTAAEDEITLASGAALVLQDNFDISGAEIVTTDFNLMVDISGSADLNTDILAFIDEDEITTLTSSVGGILTVSSATTINHLVLDQGEVEIDANLTLTGNLIFDGGTLDNDGTRRSLIFAGDQDANISLDGDYVVDNIDFTLNKSDNAILNLTGNAGDELDFLTGSTAAAPEILYLNGGILQTDDNTAVFLYQDATTQGFVRNIDAATDEESHVAGNVRKRVYQGDPFGTIPAGAPGAGTNRSARFEFPTGPGATTETPDYRPYVLTFREEITTQTDVTVNHENENPGGERGLPVASGDVLIGNYPDYFWLVEASTSLGQAQTFDVELTATDIGIPFVDEDDLRILRRFDGDATTNEWRVQGAASNYENFVSVDADGDTTAVVRVLNSSGGLVPQGARFTLGLPTRPPVFTTIDPSASITVNEGETATITFAADPLDLGETVTLSLGEDAPAFVSFDPETGVLTASPGFTDAGTYTFFVHASDQSDTTSAEVNIVVNDVNFPPVVTPETVEDQTVSDNETLTIEFGATDEDEGDVVTFGLVEDVENASIDATTGVFTFTPDFDQVGQTFNFTVFATDETDTTRISFAVTVEADILYGDANLSGDVTALDASVVLQHAAGESVIAEGTKAFTQADVSGNGEVTAFDAALILQFLTPGLLDCFPADPTCEAAAKQGMVAFGDPQWGEVSVDPQTNIITLPIALDGNVENIYAINFTADVDVELVTFKQVAGMLPDDWMMKYSFDKESGKLTVAAAGATPLSDAGVIAKATFEQLNKDSKPVFRASGFVNENASVEFGETKAEQLPTEFALGDNYPNPFNPSTSISYALPEKAQVTLEIYDVAGRLVRTLVNQEKEAGRHSIQWDGQNAAGSQVASGLYVYRIKAGSFVEAKTMMLVK